MDVCIYWQLKSHIYHHLSLSVTWISLSDLVVEINRKKILNWASQKVYFGDCLGMFPCITIILSVVPWVLVCSQIHSKGRYAGCSITSARAVAHHTRLTQTLQIELRDAKEQVEIDKDAIPSQGVTNLLSELIKPLYRLRSRQFAFSCVFVLPGRFWCTFKKNTCWRKSWNTKQFRFQSQSTSTSYRDPARCVTSNLSAIAVWACKLIWAALHNLNSAGFWDNESASENWHYAMALHTEVIWTQACQSMVTLIGTQGVLASCSLCHSTVDELNIQNYASVDPK